MEYFLDKENVKNYLILPSTFDFDLVDQELGFGKIFDIIPEEVYLQLKESTDESEKEIFRLLTKAAVHYSFVLSIPKLKVHITSFGMQEFTQEKMKSSPWWDVRDLGISLLKFADKLFSEAISKISVIEALRELIPFFKKVSPYIKSPAEFELIYSINNSPEVFLLLQQYLEDALLLNVYDKIKKECVEQVFEDEFLKKYLKSALAFYSLYYASLLPSFIFLQSAIALQYDELPWQKTIVLSYDAKIKAGENFLKLGDQNMKIIIDHMKQNPTNFPCYSVAVESHVSEARASGLYLL